MTYDIKNNESESRFETTVDGDVAVAEYFIEDGRITFTHTLVPQQLEGRGIANQLVKAALEHARAKKLAVVPQCAFVRGYIERHPEYKELVSA